MLFRSPHFWILTLKYGNEYRNAGFPVLNDIFSDFQVKTIVMFWIIASSACSLMFIYFNAVRFHLVGYGILGVNIFLVLLMAYQFYIAKSIRYKLVFMMANLYILAVLLLVIADHLLRN